MSEEDRDSSFEPNDPFSRPPEPEEVDERISKDFWSLTQRLTFETYPTHCRLSAPQSTAAAKYDLSLRRDEADLGTESLARAD
jgi:hypothetical protein